MAKIAINLNQNVNRNKKYVLWGTILILSALTASYLLKDDTYAGEEERDQAANILLDDDKKGIAQ